MSNDLSGRAMLANLNISIWTARKMDKRATASVIQQNNAGSEAGRFNKALLAKDALAEIGKIAGSARTEHYSRTLPWNDDGPRILSALGYFDYTNAMREFERDFDGAVRAFLSNYETFRDQARGMLGEMFDPADYPELESIRHKFRFRLALDPLPTSSDFRVSLGEEQIASIKADIESRASGAIQNATRDVFQRIATRAECMVSKLTAYKPGDGDERAQGIFRDSLVENVRELVNLLPSLNITNDPTLVAIGERLQDELCDYSAEDLRNDDMARADVAKKAQAILEEVSSFL